jgi:prolyl oligopeptidase
MYPPAERSDVIDYLHGRAVPDPYRWLENADAAATRSWSAGQDALVGQVRPTWTSRPALHRRLTELFAAGDVSVPEWRRSRSFERSRRSGAEMGILLTTDPDGTERILVDPMALDPSGSTTLDGWQVSAEGNLLAYQLSTGGTEFSRLFVLDVITGTIVDGPIDRVRYTSVGWLADGAGFYYVRHLADAGPGEDASLYRRVHLHRLGSDPAQDPVVFGADSPRGTYFWIQVSADGRYLTVGSSLGTDPRHDAWLADLSTGDPQSPVLRPLQVGVDARLHAHVRAGVVYLYTDRDAPRGRICACLPDELDYGSWRELVAEDQVAVLDDFVILDGAEVSRPLLVVSRTRHAVSELSRHDLATGARLGTVDLPGLGSVTGLSSRPVGGREAWFCYTDYATPSTVYRLDGRTGEVDEWRRTDGVVDTGGIRTRQVTTTSLDGTPIHLFVIEPAERPDGPTATVLYGYGGFGISLTPAFNPSIVTWVEAGGVYAVANLRGGSEEGEQWHRAGMLGGKQNVFDDFHACAEWLIESGIATPSTLALSGGSNGGLLVGAALTQHPESCAAAICSAPLLDMIRYEQFGLGSTWAGEYGHASDPDEFEWLYGYSPYHHVHPDVTYPSVMFTVFDGDSRVDPMHARKMTAALQYAQLQYAELQHAQLQHAELQHAQLQHADRQYADRQYADRQHAGRGSGPILLRREADVGHGARAVSRMAGLLADQLAFLAAQVGLTTPP